MILDIENESDHIFTLDGESIRSGQWKTDKSIQIAAKANTRLEFSGQLEGVQGLIWFTDDATHSIYLSIAFQFPLIHKNCFAAWAGLPPPNLKTELSQAPRFVKDDVMKPEGACCSWTGTPDGVKLFISSELPLFVPPTAASLAANPSMSNESGDSAADDKDGIAKFSPPARAANEASSEDAAKEAAGFIAQTRPKDAGDGFKRGLKTAGKSLAGGLGMAVAMPVAGAQQGGVLGFAKGLGVGIIGGAAIAVGGTVAGAAQVGRGIYMAPAAHYARREEKVWDQETGAWVDGDLCADEKALEAENSDEEGGPTGSDGGNVKETEYYDLLSVKSDASQSEIKKAYFKMARVCHPDKNIGDDEATQKFQKLSEVYQVLSDPDSRKKYDRDGKDGLQEQSEKMDPALFFSLLFGSEHFTPWTGELSIAMQAKTWVKAMERGDAEEEEPEPAMPSSDSVRKRQERREVRCAVHLRNKLDRLVYGREEEGWTEQMKMEAHQLGADSGQFGPALLTTLGEMYQVRSEIYLANELAGRHSLSKRRASMKQNFMRMHHMVSFYKSAAGTALQARRAYSAAQAIDKEMKKDEIEGEEVDEEKEEVQAKKMQAIMDDALPSIMKTAWAYIVRDIDETVKMVARKFLQDKSVPWQIRIRRGQALERLGRIFSEAGEKAAAELAANAESEEIMQGSAKAALQEALMASMQKK